MSKFIILDTVRLTRDFVDHGITAGAQGIITQAVDGHPCEHWVQVGEDDDAKLISVQENDMELVEHVKLFRGDLS